MDSQLKQDIFTLARTLGFDLMGVTEPRVADPSRYLEWLEAGRHGSMAYMARNIEKRLDPRKLVPEVQSILCLGVNYFQPLADCSNRAGRIARYAWGKDYHLVLRDMLHRLADEIGSLLKRNLSYRAFVDSAPVLEKPLAQQAGLGWIGKNGCLINKRLGSFFFLGELFLDVDLPPDEPAKNHCGQCQKCLDACPTRAIVSPGLIDARRCISYLTIEHKGPIDPELAPKMDGWLFGCDACQEVCPFNQKIQATTITEFQHPVLGPRIDLAEILTWDEQTHQARTRHSAGDRADLLQWQRNAGTLLIQK